MATGEVTDKGRADGLLRSIRGSTWGTRIAVVLTVPDTTWLPTTIPI